MDFCSLLIPLSLMFLDSDMGILLKSKKEKGEYLLDDIIGFKMFGKVVKRIGIKDLLIRNILDFKAAQNEESGLGYLNQSEMLLEVVDLLNNKILAN